MSSKILIIAGEYKVGDRVGGRTISGLGKTFEKYVRDDEACCFGLMPGQDYYINMQYAYFNYGG